MSIDWENVLEKGKKIAKSATKTAINNQINGYDSIARNKKYSEEKREIARQRRDELKMKKEMYFDD